MNKDEQYQNAINLLYDICWLLVMKYDDPLAKLFISIAVVNDKDLVLRIAKFIEGELIAKSRVN